ncbi:MAG: dihydroorotate dehydrogenase, partial [Ruminococcaceae bacterium]|nr:dihydroorotate dehydrogenase [Oscillospiraceae bacterium]
VSDYVYAAQRLSAQEQVGIVEVNISCPNVHAGGMAFGTSPDAAAEVTAAVKKVSKKPVFIKLSPNVSDIASIAKACEQAGADGLCLINTLLGMRIDLNSRKPLLANVTGGLSGPAVFPVALRMVYEVYEAVRVPIIGVGGISCASDVLEMMLAGATAVQVGAANLADPFACPKIIEALPEAMEKYGISDIKSIIGGAH